MAALHMSAAAPPTDEEVRGLQHQVNVFTVAAQHARVRLLGGHRSERDLRLGADALNTQSALTDHLGVGLHI
jgi:hypothetical protein